LIDRQKNVCLPKSGEFLRRSVPQIGNISISSPDDLPDVFSESGGSIRVMKTILVLSSHPEMAEAVRAGLNPEGYRVIHRTGQDEADPMLAHGLAHAVVIDVEFDGVQNIWLIERLRRRNSRCPIIVYTGAKHSEWEEEAFLHGATHVLSKPVRARALTAVLERVFTVAPPVAAAAAVRSEASVAPAFGAVPAISAQPLTILRNFSSLLTHSLNSDAMLRQFLLQLREIVSLNRAAIFLRPNYSGATPTTPEDSRRLRPAAAIGLSPGLLEHFELSLDSGIGGQLFRLGRILRRSGDEVRNDLEALKEFELLGGQVAVPIFDRDSLLGLAVFDGRITGEALTNPELELIFHLLEQVGLAVRNIWLHDQLAGNNEMMTNVLRELNSACVVVSRDLKILHANKMARKFFHQISRPNGELEFTDLPQALGAKVYQVLRSGTAIAPFKHEPEGAPGTIYSVTVAPFQKQGSALPVSALLVVDDQTQSEQLRRLEVETANLRLVKTMADRLAHEVGNAMVPLSTHQQLLAEKYKDPEFRASLDTALAEGVKRVNRLINQMRFLARDSVTAIEQFPLSPLIEEAYQEARKYQPVKAALKYENGGKPVFISGDRAALKYALTEIMINALQANPNDPKVGVRLGADANGGVAGDLQIEVQDNGGGFTPEAVQKAVAPFYTTRNVGLGLGLTVTRKIIETHHGKLEIVPPQSGNSGMVRISLPMEKAVATAN
jgi:signal transduction histidine kinase/DNA-binding NarL/FixJ family response regulator